MKVNLKCRFLISHHHSLTMVSHHTVHHWSGVNLRGPVMHLSNMTDMFAKLRHVTAAETGQFSMQNSGQYYDPRGDLFLSRQS